MIQKSEREIELEIELLELKALVQSLRDEIARLKGEKGKPVIKPTVGLETKKANKNKNRRASKKNKFNKAKELKNVKIIPVEPEDIPQGSVRNGYQDFYVQNLL